MTTRQWNNLLEADHDAYAEKYREFMSDSRNLDDCENCPENSGCSLHECHGPCGQQNCWVEVHSH